MKQVSGMSPASRSELPARWERSFFWSMASAGVLIMLLAFALRVVVIFDRARNDPLFADYPEGSDQQVYVTQAALWERGEWPRAPFQWQPGFTYFLVGVRALLGRSIGQMTLGLALLSAWSCGLMVAAGWLATGRRWGGYLAGALLACYPVAVFYSSVLLTESLATICVVLFLLLTLWQRLRLAWWRSALIGLTLGLLAITRSNLTPLWLAWALALWWWSGGRWRAWGAHAALSLLFLALPILPVALWNRQAAGGGDFALITTTGIEEVYRGNNRDATGLRSGDPAWSSADNGYLAALISDIRRDPLRFGQLLLRKAGLYWSAVEPANNVDYDLSGEQVSPLLRALPLNFGSAALLGWLGALLLPRLAAAEGWRLAAFFALVNLLIFAGVMALWVEGRLKQPAVPSLLISAACVPLALAEALRGRAWRWLARQAALPAVGLLLLYGGLIWAMDNLPRALPLRALPPDALPLGIVFDERLELVGWRALPEWPAAQRGWSHFLRSYMVQLYWRVTRPVEQDYDMYLAYIDGDQRLAGFDRRIGTVSFRPHPTRLWQPGEIYSEIVGFRLPRDLPLERSLEVRLGVYLRQGEGSAARIQPVAADSLPGQPLSFALQRLAIVDTGYLGARPAGFDQMTLDFGGQIALKGYTMPSQAQRGERVTLSFNWVGLAEMTTDYTQFVHLFAPDGALAAQIDTAPRGGDFLTSTWPPDYPIRDEIALQLPDVPGVYAVYIGWYDSRTFERLAVDAPDNRWRLGEIRVP